MASDQQPTHPSVSREPTHTLAGSRRDGLSGRAFTCATVALALLLFAVGSALPGQTHAPAPAAERARR